MTDYRMVALKFVEQWNESTSADVILMKRWRNIASLKCWEIAKLGTMPNQRATKEYGNPETRRMIKVGASLRKRRAHGTSWRIRQHPIGSRRGFGNAIVFLLLRQ